LKLKSVFLEMLQELKEWASAHEEEMAALAAELVAIDTTNPPGRNYGRCAEFIADKLADFGFSPRLIPVPVEAARRLLAEDDPLPRVSLLTTYGPEGPRFHFHGHYDVVPAFAPEQFRPHIAGGKLFGRGAADMKGGLASTIYALRAIKELGLPLGGQLCLSVVPDEETGGAAGTGYLFAERHLRPGGRGMLMAESTGGAAWNANRGALSLEVRVRGKSAHVGLAHEGINAFERMVHLANALLALKEQVETRETRFAVEPAEARRSILLLGGRCAGGVNFNVVPESCTFTIDRRFNPEESLAEVKAELLGRLAELEEIADFAVKILQEGDSAGLAGDAPLARTLAQAAADVLGTAPAFVMCPGLLEIRFFLAHGIPALAYGPGLLSLAHGPDEYVETKALGHYAAIYALVATRVLAAAD
jgi:succinyl-diaminopimelate desuccinylase